MFLVTIKHLKSYLETFITEICQYMKQKENKTNLMDHSVFQAHNPKRRNNILEQRINSWLKQKKFCKRREKIIEGFENGIFPLNYDEEEQQELRDKEEENKIRDEYGLIDYKRLKRLIDLKNREINNELVKKHFQVQHLRALLEKLKK